MRPLEVPEFCFKSVAPVHYFLNKLTNIYIFFL